MRVFPVPVFHPADDGGTPVDNSAPVVAPVETPVVDAPVTESPKPEKQPWFLGRIAEEKAKREDADRRAADAEKRATEAIALAQRMGNVQPQNDGRQTPAPIQPPTGDRQAEISREATRQRLFEDSTEVVNKGISEFGASFTTTQQILNAVGASTDDFVADVIAVDRDNAHVIFTEIAKNPERASALARMDSRRRVVELTKMSSAVSKSDPASVSNPLAPAPGKTSVSRAPAPSPRVTPQNARQVDGYSDDASDEEFTRQFQDRMKQRAERRR